MKRGIWAMLLALTLWCAGAVPASSQDPVIPEGEWDWFGSSTYYFDNVLIDGTLYIGDCASETTLVVSGLFYVGPTGTLSGDGALHGLRLPGCEWLNSLPNGDILVGPEPRWIGEWRRVPCQ